MKKVYLISFILIILFAIFLVYEKKDKKILFVGDMNFDRYIRQMGNSKGQDFIFSCSGLSDFLKNSDLVVGNLEGPITDNPSISLGSEVGTSTNFIFTFPPSTAKLLERNNIKLVNLGNNHIGNFGMEGLDSTEKYLNSAGINYFGGFGGDELVYRTEIGGNKISFVSYNEFGSEPLDNIFEKIKKEKQNGQIVFVYAHWGDEYSEVPKRVKDIANLFVKFGADLIIGSHPHIILPSQKIDNSLVYYSLGNFIFDQYWNKEVSTGLVLEVDIKGKEIKIIEHKVHLNRDGRTCLIN